MIEAIIHYQDSTLIMDLPRNIYDIHEKLMSIGCPTAPGRIPLTDNEDDALRVKLYGRIEMGNHLIRILSEQNTLADANALASVVLNASDDIKLKLGEKIVKDQYDSIPEIVTDIRQMTYDAGPIKRTFYCPLVGNIEDGYDDTFTVGSSFLRDYAWAIEDAIERIAVWTIRTWRSISMKMPVSKTSWLLWCGVWKFTGVNSSERSNAA